MTEPNEHVHYEQYKIVFNGPGHDSNKFEAIVQRTHNDRVWILFRHSSENVDDPSCGARMSLDGLEYIGKFFAALAKQWRENELDGLL